MEPSPEKIIEQLLDQNSSLRLELAVLSALVRQQQEIDDQLNQSREIPPEAVELLSKLDIK